MSLCCKCCVLSGRGLCVGLITRPGSPTECGVSERDREAPIRRGGMTRDLNKAPLGELQKLNTAC